MNNSIDTQKSSSFFPETAATKARNMQRAQQAERALQRNSPEKAKSLYDKSQEHASVSINDATRDFSRIKSAVDIAEPIDNSARIAALKAKIQNGTYEMDYDAIAEKMLETEI